MTSLPTPGNQNAPLRQKLDVVQQLGLKAQALATQHQALLGDRVSAACLQSLAADLASLGSDRPTVITSHGESIHLTAEQAASLARGHQLARGARMAVRGQKPGKEVLLAYGVGHKVDRHLVKDVKASLQTIIDRATAQKAEAARFGIVDADVAAMKQSLAEIAAAEKAHGGARVAAPKTTAQRNATGRRILAAVKLIAGAGIRAFVADPTTAAQFEALTKKAK